MSKLLLYDFECTTCGSEFEELVKTTFFTATCPKCSGTGRRLIPTGKINYRKMGVDPDFPTAGEKWAKMQEQRKRVENAKERG